MIWWRCILSNEYMNSSAIIFFYFLLVVVAFLYSAVGHGGASGYLALMSLFLFGQEEMRPTALLLNLVVSFISFIQYYRGGHFKWSLFWPFALASVPAAFLGGQLSIDSGLYKKILGVLLLLSVIRLTGIRIKTSVPDVKQHLSLALIIGASIGFVSGLIGIGGGIILSPVIMLLNWADIKQTSAVSALFIFVNSLAGLGGLFSKGFHLEPDFARMAGLALLGGVAGSYFGASRLKPIYLQRLLAFVLLIASIKLIFV